MFSVYAEGSRGLGWRTRAQTSEFCPFRGRGPTVPGGQPPSLLPPAPNLPPRCPGGRGTFLFGSPQHKIKAGTCSYFLTQPLGYSSPSAVGKGLLTCPVRRGSDWVFTPGRRTQGPVGEPAGRPGCSLRASAGVPEAGERTPTCIQARERDTPTLKKTRWDSFPRTPFPLIFKVLRTLFCKPVVSCRRATGHGRLRSRRPGLPFKCESEPL